MSKVIRPEYNDQFSYISTVTCHPSQEAQRAHGRVPHTVNSQPHCLQFPEMEMWRPHREARTSNCTPRQSQPRCRQGQSSAGATNHQKPSSNICHPKLSWNLWFYLGNTVCCLFLSSPFEPKLLVITGEIRVIALTKDNMDKFNKSSKKKCK